MKVFVYNIIYKYLFLKFIYANIITNIENAILFLLYYNNIII